MKLPKVPPWVWLVWFLVFVLLEAIALWNGNPNDTLTATTIIYVPGVIVVCFVAWLAYHFWFSVHDKNDTRR